MSPISSLQIIGSKKLGGAESFFIRLHQAFNETDDLPSTAVVPPTSELVPALQSPYTTAPMRSVFDPFSCLGLRRLIRRQAPAIVQTWMGRATRLVRIREGRGPVHVARLGGFYNPAHYRHVHALVGNTRGICDYLVRNGFDAGRVHYIGNFVPPHRLLEATEIAQARARLGLDESDLIVFALGRLHVNKAFDTLLQAFEKLPETIGGRRVRLLLAGDGPLADEISHFVQGSSAGPRIHLLGWQRDPSPFFAVANLFVCPSRHEPLGNVILEAWAHGKPVLSTRTDGALELIEDGRTGVIVDIDDSIQLAEGMKRLLSDDGLVLDNLAAAGASELAARFSQQAIVGAYRDLYSQLTARTV